MTFRATGMLVLVMSALASAARASEPGRHGVRLGLASGTGLVFPPSCRDCNRFYGRGLSVAIEVGWAVRSDFLVVLTDDVIMIPFADGFVATAGRIEVAVSRFISDRTWIRLGSGLGGRDSGSDVPAGQRYGVALSAGAGRELARSGAWSLDVQAQASCTVGRWILMPQAVALVGVSWN